MATNIVGSISVFLGTTFGRRGENEKLAGGQMAVRHETFSRRERAKWPETKGKKWRSAPNPPFLPANIARERFGTFERNR